MELLCLALMVALFGLSALLVYACKQLGRPQ